MAQIQVNLEGVSVAVDNRKVQLHILKLDAQNPRIGLYKDSQPKATFSDDEIGGAKQKGAVLNTKGQGGVRITGDVYLRFWISRRSQTRA